MSNFQITIYCGPSGTGKTEFLKSRVMSHDGLVIVFDLGGSYQEAIHRLGGQIIQSFDQIETGRPAYLLDFETIKGTACNAEDIKTFVERLMGELDRDTSERKLIVIDEAVYILADVALLVKDLEGRNDVEIAISAQDMRDVKNVKADRTVTLGSLFYE